MTTAHQLALKCAAVLWVIWGIVHLLAGVIVLLSDTLSGFQAIADAVDPAALEAEYHVAVGGILNQHGWNLGWFGVATIIGAVFVWRQNITAIWVTGMVGGMADLGYLMFVDIRLRPLRARNTDDLCLRYCGCAEFLGLVVQSNRRALYGSIIWDTCGQRRTTRNTVRR
ncbi:MAG: hypothetical protein AB3N09_05500 [Tateyamaria sp.]